MSRAVKAGLVCQPNNKKLSSVCWKDCFVPSIVFFAKCWKSRNDSRLEKSCRGHEKREHFRSLFSLSCSPCLAFTLAEVLITLGIIGIVASLTIPALIANSQKQQNLTQLKKFYTTFNQGLQQMAQDYGCPGDLKCTGIFDVGIGDYRKNSVYVMQILAKYIKTDKICGSTDSLAPQFAATPGCFGAGSRPYKMLNGDNATVSNFYELNLGDRIWGTLQDGTFYGVLNDWAGSSPSGCKNGFCGFVYVDVNGAKKPNQMGRDLFYFAIGDKAILVPVNNQNSPCDNTNNCVSDNTGTSCSCKILKDSWQMNY